MGNRRPVVSHSTVIPARSARRTRFRVELWKRCAQTVSKPPSRSSTWASRGTRTSPRQPPADHASATSGFGLMLNRASGREASTSMTCATSSLRVPPGETRPPVPQLAGIEFTAASIPDMPVLLTIGKTTERPLRCWSSRLASRKLPERHKQSTQSGDWLTSASRSRASRSRQISRGAGLTVV